MRRSESESVEAFRRTVEGLANICAENARHVPEWMQCHFFREGLKFSDKEELALLDAEIEGLATDVSIEAIITVLEKCAERLETLTERI